MRVTDLPPNLVRMPATAGELYVPQETEPERRPRTGLKALAVALAVVGASALFAERTGEQGILAAFVGGAPSWAATVRAPDPGVAMSPHIAAGPLTASLGPDPMPTVRARKDDSRLPQGVVDPSGAATDAALSFAATRTSIEAPFALVLGEEGTAEDTAAPQHAAIPARQHWWSDRPLPQDISSEASLRCLAEVIYFEAANESERAKRAVAQVVVNRVKNPAYPDDVCGVVYQNSDEPGRCQFLFACDGTDDAITRPDVFAEAERIAGEYAAGTAWLDDIGAATHYHGRGSTPSWARLMVKAGDIGHLTFYITRDGGWT